MKKNILLSLAVLLLCACSTDPIKENKLTFEIDQKAVKKAEDDVQRWKDTVDKYEAEYQEAIKDKTKNKIETDIIKERIENADKEMKSAQKELEKTKNTLVGSEEMKIVDGIAVINLKNQLPIILDDFIDKAEKKVLPMLLENREQFNNGAIIAFAETLKSGGEAYVFTAYVKQEEIEKLTPSSRSFLKYAEARNVKIQLEQVVKSKSASNNESVPEEYYNYLAEYHE